MNLPEPSSVKSVAIISTGVIGASWAAYCLVGGDQSHGVHTCHATRYPSPVKSHRVDVERV